MKGRILSALILMGFTSLVVQALLIREFLITFYGNELTIGLILACWIISEALGSGLASKFSSKAKSPFLTYSLLQILICIYLPISIFLIRAIKNILPITPGEAVGIIPVLVSCIFIIGPLSIFDGMQFPFGCRLHSIYQRESKQAPGRVYILEAIGFIIAGAVFTYVFLTRLHSFQIGLIIGLMNLVSGWLLLKEAPSFLKRPLRIFVSVLIFFILYLLLSNLSPKFHNWSIAKQWKNQNIVEYKNSIYGNLAVSRQAEQYTFYSDGIPVINIPTPDIAQTEEFVHFGLLSHPSPRKILFLSGGAGGPIAEALKHPIDRIDYAELDPLLIKLLKKFPKEITKKELSNSKVNLKITDGIRFVKETDSKYDAVFVSIPSPTTLQLNRYYTKEFFGLIKGMLSPGGQLILRLPGSLSYINKEQGLLNLCILTTLKGVYPHVFVIPGDNNLYISSPSPLKITPEIFMRRIEERRISANTLTPTHLEYRLKKYWQDWFYDSIDDKTLKVKENRNLAPIGVFYGLSYWNSLFSPYLRGLFKTLDRLKFNHIILYMFLFVIILFICKTLFSKFRNMGVGVSIATTGFAGMSLDLIFILSYQVFFGYVYHHIALLVASFMAGLTLGGWIVTKNLEKIRRDFAWFLAMEISVILFCLGSGLFLTYLNGIRQFGFYPVFYILSCVSGVLVGFEFPLANKLRWHDASYLKTAGVLYAMDLLGAFFAALLVSIIFIPIFGVLKTCVFLGALKTAGLLLFLNSKRLR